MNECPSTHQHHQQNEHTSVPFFHSFFAHENERETRNNQKRGEDSYDLSVISFLRSQRTRANKTRRGRRRRQRRRRQRRRRRRRKKQRSLLLFISVCHLFKRIVVLSQCSRDSSVKACAFFFCCTKRSRKAFFLCLFLRTRHNSTTRTTRTTRTTNGDEDEESEA